MRSPFPVPTPLRGELAPIYRKSSSGRDRACAHAFCFSRAWLVHPLAVYFEHVKRFAFHEAHKLVFSRELLDG